MENIVQLLNNAIGWSIIHSLWQGASLYIILYGLFLIFYKWSSDTKYKISYLFQCLTFASFIITLIKYLQSGPFESQLTKTVDNQDLMTYFTYLHNQSWSITQMFPYIIALYSLGLFVQTFLCIKSFLWINKIKRTSARIIPTEWLNLLKDIKSSHKIPLNINLITSSTIEGPMTIGFLKPLIIFPTAYINKITTEEAEAILLHEIAHIKRFDYFFNLNMVMIETILFFNPFVWLISRHIKLEREQSCDDYVTKHIQNPIIYARTLLHVELLRNEYQTSQALALSGNNRYDLYNRIKRLNKQMMEATYTSYKQQLSVILCASMTFIFIAWVNPNSGQETKKENYKTITTITEKKETNVTIDTINPQAKPTLKIQKRKLDLKNDTSIVIISNKKDIDALTENLELLSETIEYKANSNVKVYLSNIEKNATEIEKKFNSPEWKSKIARIELNGKDLEAYFQSPEWKKKVEQLEVNAKKIDEHFKSTDWKEKIAKIEINTKQLEDKFTSPEWQKKFQELERLYKSNEYKAILNKYREEIKELKKQKGLE